MNDKQAEAKTVTQQLDELFAPWNRSDVPGLVVGIAQRGQLLYRRGFGLASIEHGLANTPTVRMRIGSTTKHFCCLGIMLLSEEGKLDIGQPVRRYLPELANLNGEPTLLQLMQHTGGVRDPMVTAFFIHGGVYGNPPDGHTLPMMAAMSECNFAPGRRFAYCNSGYTLLSLVIERISGQRWEDFIAERVLRPLGMSSTTLLRSDLDIVPDVATFHFQLPDGRWRRGIFPGDELLGSGGMISTVDDMLRWTAHLRRCDKQVGSAATWAKMLERPVFGDGVSGNYCLGLMHDRYRGVATIHHAGATLGAQCQMLVVPEHELDVVVLTNRMDAAAPALALKVLDVVLASALEPVDTPPPAGEFLALQGHWYSRSSRSLMSIAAAKSAQGSVPEALQMSLYNAPLSNLQRRGSGLARPDGAFSSLEIRNPPTGSELPASIDVHICGELECFERLAEPAPSVAELAGEVCGRYRYAEFGKEVEIVLKDGRLLLDLLPPYGRGQWEIEVRARDVLACGTLHVEPASPLPNSANLSLDWRDGKVTGFWLDMDRVRQVRFDRC